MVVDSNPEMAVQCNPQLGKVEILPLPTIIGETAILRLEFEERVQHRLTRHEEISIRSLFPVSIRKGHLLLSSLGRRVLSLLSFQSWLWLLVHAQGYGLVSDPKLVKHYSLQFSFRAWNSQPKEMWNSKD